MSRFHSYVLSAKSILQLYKGELPFAIFLKKYFSGNKKFGSKDRKLIAECCYAWFRCAHLFKQNCTEDNIITSLFFCNNQSNTLLQNLHPNINNNIHLPVTDKLKLYSMEPADVFPFYQSIGSIEKEVFALSLFQQPSLFLRARPGNESTVKQKLENSNINFSVYNDCFELPNASRLDDVILINKEAVVQDKSSQKVFDYLRNKPIENTTLEVWDCCAASGGKSILLNDLLKKKYKLTVSDIRPSILHNCKQRLQQAGINIAHAFVADISKPIPGLASNKFDIIICDAPCTGSGTWGRTPEQLAFFEESKIAEYSALQKSIAKNAAAYLKPQGMFIYITCSVFEKENEEVVNFLKQQTSLKLSFSNYLPGYQCKADTLFVAVFKS
ncbi:MAG TPA: methyltransferase domain-containing protein [Ferruginibacter sp.]|nr:methyltransferase domain-containing protein [Ferruginibacter sp.]HRE63744.1 methyltransferase domain-containing protein [Ferruginibacter sp.]